MESRINDNSDAVRKAADKQFSDLMRDFMEHFTMLVKEYCPHPPEKPPSGYQRTGTLQLSIDCRFWAGTVRKATIKVWTTAGYGGWVELGTKKMKGQLYFLRAFKETLREFGLKATVHNGQWMIEPA